MYNRSEKIVSVGFAWLWVLKLEACSTLTLEVIRHSWIFRVRKGLPAVHERPGKLCMNDADQSKAVGL